MRMRESVLDHLVETPPDLEPSYEQCLAHCNPPEMYIHHMPPFSPPSSHVYMYEGLLKERRVFKLLLMLKVGILEPSKLRAEVVS